MALWQRVKGLVDCKFEKIFYKITIVWMNFYIRCYALIKAV